MSALMTSLDELTSKSEACDYQTLGFHQRHAVDLDAVVDIARAFREAGYILEMITCQDRREENQKMVLCYTFNRLSEVDRHLLKLEIDVESEEVPTLCQVYRAANWFEREVFDMYGVRFSEHPNLERILLPEDADFFALRRDFGRIEEAEEAEEASDE